ncbi:NUDIX domain-containing protein [Vibrio cholerae]|uniref:NUDIX domain-containing protein n=1 Tax=Vibrio cholerae TaxID=666 RepID=UPI00115B0233|nr:NUDIX domain-containing protein [Vibrio cholerae]EGQ7641363.1 NUDIX domain-containing protein [Vibrio cholerae]EJL6325716.1 NUDIX domain-containing protein [Vibrio cholerae]EJL6539173.1 NUDIX domain-containing protein [Vibrio cholerae]EJL6769368.1 NUDIX domain-containing protein [Vibrio cholerae]EJN3163178.1 NUDIX domain-containing protein [Vibrio cholerae]
MINYVTGFMFSQDLLNVGLIKKLKPKWQSGLYNGIGGKIEHDESPYEAIAREFQEETGVETKPDEWKLYVTLTRPDIYRVYFLCMISDKVHNIRTTEEEIVKLLPCDALPKNVIHNLRWLIPLALDKSLSMTTPIYIEEIKNP